MEHTNLVAVTQSRDLFQKWLKSPVADLLLSHNLRASQRKYERAELLICACIDYRVTLNIPSKSAFIIRTPGANLIDNEFGLASAISMANIRAVAIIAHTDCAMTKITANQGRFVEKLTESGWTRDDARRFYSEEVNLHAVADPTGFAVKQCQQLRQRYANILFAPLVYDVQDGKLYQVVE